MAEEIIKAIPNLDNHLFGKYALTKFCILYVLREILENDGIVNDPAKYVRAASDRDHFRKCIGTIVAEIVGDLNDELREFGEDFDYRDKLRDADWVKEVRRRSAGDHRRLVNRGKLDSFPVLWDSSRENEGAKTAE